MKIRYLITGLLASALAFAGCENPDELTRLGNENVSNLVVKGRLVTAETTEYDAIVDEASKTITVQVPWYISDTEKIQGDLTQMKLSATMPIGAHFEPGLSGIHDLQTGIQRTLVRENGTQTLYTLKAVYAKSNKAILSKVSLVEAPNAVIAIKEPETAGGDGAIQVYRTSSSVGEAMKSATVTISPWATVESTGLQPDGTIDLSDLPDVYVIAQNGTRRKYVTTISYPEFVPSGQIGYKTLIFGYQITAANPRGFIATENRTLAVVGDYLVVSSVSLNFVVLNRYSGDYLPDLKVNTTGLPTGVIHAITTDDAGHMVAITFAAMNNQWVANKQFEIYVWKNGIFSAPEKVFSEHIGTSDAFAQFRSTNASVALTGTWDIGRMVSIKGDMTGDAMLMTLANSVMNRLLRVKFEGGKVASVLGSWRGLDSWAAQSKPIPLSTKDECAYVMASANANRWIYYTPDTEGASIKFLPKDGWWPTGLIGIDYIEFNGTKLVGLQNSNALSATQFYCRLCVVDISSMSPAAFTNAQIMDSRLDNYDPNHGPVGPGLQNPTLTGMTSQVGALGTNGNKTGDVVFGQSADGNAVQVYMLTTDQGILAYELTRYDI